MNLPLKLRELHLNFRVLMSIGHNSLTLSLSLSLPLSLAKIPLSLTQLFLARHQVRYLLQLLLGLSGNLIHEDVESLDGRGSSTRRHRL